MSDDEDDARALAAFAAEVEDDANFNISKSGIPLISAHTLHSSSTRSHVMSNEKGGNAHASESSKGEESEERMMRKREDVVAIEDDGREEREDDRYREQREKSEEMIKLIKVKEHWKIQPGDSEEDKRRKRKRLKAVGKKNKARLKVKKRNEQQSNWLSFHKKMKGKRIRGSMSGLRKSSIFRSPDNLDGRVGVTGSGSGMTTFVQRKKYKLKR